ncbi:helix-turn-helix domain-containing protein [Nonomuraea sp. CA-141351]|uniref:helix-turn-helix domain-containing protein n=1 Tax=Nonomuraea sp. CA-141351 TaxID=3239996 RepID=UPI003D8C4441
MTETIRASLQLMRLARELRQLREQAGLTAESAADRLGWSRYKVTRIETCKTRPTPLDVAAALNVYDAAASARAALMRLAHEARNSSRAWWTKYGDVLTGAFVGLEDAAAAIRSWQPQLVPGLLQTEEYARAVISVLRPEDSPELIERRVLARMRRRELLDRDDAPRLQAVISEASLVRPIGGWRTMGEQLRALATEERPNVELRVLPFDIGAHPGLEGPFVILGFPKDVYPDVVYLDHINDDVLVEPLVAGYQRRWSSLMSASLDPGKSRERIVQIMEAHSDQS